PRGASPDLVGVVDGMADLVPQDAHARFGIAAFHFEHLRELQLRQPRMREVIWNRYAGNAVRREPLVGQPEARPEPQAAHVELGVDLGDPLLELGALDRDAEIAHPHLEELLVGQRYPFGIAHGIAELQNCRIAESKGGKEEGKRKSKLIERALLSTSPYLVRKHQRFVTASIRRTAARSIAGRSANARA